MATKSTPVVLVGVATPFRRLGMATPRRFRRECSIPCWLTCLNDLLAQLEAIKGKTWLCEFYARDVAKYRLRRGNAPTEYKPEQLANTNYDVFLEFNKTRPDQQDLLPYGLRRRAITKMTLATQSVDATAHAVGVDSATARRYYLNAQKAFDADALFTKMAGNLRPTTTG